MERTINLAYSEAQKKASRKYNEKKYDRINIYVNEGSRSKIKSHADATGKSLNAFINEAIFEKIEREDAMEQSDIKPLAKLSE